MRRFATAKDIVDDDREALDRGLPVVGAGCGVASASRFRRGQVCSPADGRIHPGRVAAPARFPLSPKKLELSRISSRMLQRFQVLERSTPAAAQLAAGHRKLTSACQI